MPICAPQLQQQLADVLAATACQPAGTHDLERPTGQRRVAGDRSRPGAAQGQPQQVFLSTQLSWRLARLSAARNLSPPAAAGRGAAEPLRLGLILPPGLEEQGGFSSAPSAPPTCGSKPRQSAPRSLPPLIRAEISS